MPEGPDAWCCSLDGDIQFLLTCEEGEQYLERSLNAAALSSPGLAPCPLPNCKGMAIAGNVKVPAWCVTGCQRQVADLRGPYESCRESKMNVQ